MLKDACICKKRKTVSDLFWLTAGFFLKTMTTKQFFPLHLRDVLFLGNLSKEKLVDSKFDSIVVIYPIYQIPVFGIVLLNLVYYWNILNVVNKKFVVPDVHVFITLFISSNFFCHKGRVELCSVPQHYIFDSTLLIVQKHIFARYYDKVWIFKCFFLIY